jgi:tetratricopeptide (TPR) repeat protein
MSARRRRKKKKPSRTERDIQRHKIKRQSPAGKRVVSTRKVANKQKAVKEVAAEPITGWRLWLLRIIAITVVPGLLFLLVELSLRVVGCGFPAAAIIKCEVDGRSAYCDNVKFGWRFFPKNIARESDPFVFAADKPDNTCRIFILGASAAQGAPDDAFGFGRFLRVMLREAYPAVNFEVITTAMTAINSHVVLQMAKDCARHEPDLFIVYLGNNEVVGPYGAGTVFAPLSGNLSAIRAGIALRATRVGQLLTSLMGLAAGQDNNPVLWRGMAMFLEKQIRADAPGLQAVYRHFQSNLGDITRIARNSAGNVILCTVGSNLKDSPPFASLHRSDITDAETKQWDDACRQAAEYENAGEYAKAAERYLAAARIDEGYAELQFRLGRCYWALGEYDKARERYVKARELDTLRFRADTRINQIIRSVADEAGAEDVHLVDAVDVFEENSPYEIAGGELFHEHVHLNFKGNYLLARAVFEKVEKALPDRIKRHKAKDRSLLSEMQCAQRLAYTEMDQYRIAHMVLNNYIKKAPFTNQFDHAQRVRQLEEDLAALEANLTAEVLEKAAAKFRLAIQNAPEDWWLRWRYAELLAGDLKDDRAAIEQCRLVLDHLPHFHIAHAQLGELLSNMGQSDAAIAHYREAIRIKPTSANAHYNLGLAYQSQNKLDKAVKHYSTSLRLQPDHGGANTNLGAVLYRQGKTDKAVEVYRKALLFAPDAADMRFNLGILLEKQGRTDEAIEELRTALRIDPNSAEVRRAIRTFQERRDGKN